MLCMFFFIFIMYTYFTYICIYMYYVDVYIYMQLCAKICVSEYIFIYEIMRMLLICGCIYASTFAHKIMYTHVVVMWTCILI